MAKIKNFKYDLEKYYLIEYGRTNPRSSKVFRLWVTNFGLHCVACYRLGQFADRMYKLNKLLGLIPKLMYAVLNYLIQMVHHVNIEAIEIGPGFYIGHVGTIYVGPTKLGSNVSLSHNTTIGIGHAANAVGIPVLGNNIWIGTGAIISGGITIGDNATITSGCVLSRSIPERSLAAGNPGRVVLSDYNNASLLVWKNPVEQLPE